MSSSLRPGWKTVGEGGFSPPSNHFAALDDDEGDGKDTNNNNIKKTSAATSTNRNTAKKIVRYTRERLLSLRSNASNDDEWKLTSDFIWMPDAQDPVCWDDFQPEDIWAKTNERRTTTPRTPNNRWQRGVALPTRQQQQPQQQQQAKTDDLWDDPVSNEAATDFSAFGKSLDDEKPLEAVAQQSKQEPKKKFPGAIQSGSGNDVNVFGDDIGNGSGLTPTVDEPLEETIQETIQEPPKVQESDVDASTRLMAMIGVTSDPPKDDGWGAKPDISPNPWGGSLLQTPHVPAVQPPRPQPQVQPPPQVQPRSEIEVILVERIVAILEQSWGRQDLNTILHTLHNEDARVIPLLSNVNLLRTLIVRNSQKLGLDGPDVAVLTNHQQLQQQKQQRELEQQQRKAEEQRRRQEARRMPPPPTNVGTLGIQDAPWFYSDPQQNIQGPFGAEEMRQWLEAGYFKGDLPVSQESQGPFYPLSSLFPDTVAAFLPRKSLEELQREAQAEEARQKAAREANGDHASELKRMLGVTPAPAPEPPAPAKKSKKKKPKEVAVAVEPTPSSAWGGAAPPAQSRKSMSEIQMEEARRTAMEQAKRPQNSSGWANVAATKGSSWAGGVKAPMIAPSSVQQPRKPKAPPKPVSQSATPTKAQASEDFGTAMAPPLESWCKEQLLKLNGSEDLTLVHFCMTLDDPSEIRQYLSAYLGSTPQVNSFASEFIRKSKGQEEWEPAANAKKKGKKKTAR